MKLPIIALLACGLPLVSAVSVIGNDLSPEAVRKAMAKGVSYLEGSQHTGEGDKSGTWTEYATQEGGITALCTLALLNAGESPDEPHVARALRYLRSLPARTTYVVSLQTMVLCRANPVADQDIIARNVEWLEATQIKEGLDDSKGGWSYGSSQNEKVADGSNSQFALLALYEARRAAETYPDQMSLKIDRDDREIRRIWERVRKYWVANHSDDGSWAYKKLMPGSGSMTCAGISSLVIADDVLHEPDARVNVDQIDPCYRDPAGDQDLIESGLGWLGRHFSVHGNPPVGPSDSGLWHYYYLYGLERAGRLSARRKIGSQDWYREGAAYLVDAIDADLMRSSWKGRAHAEGDENIATALALLFLSKGRWPVLMAKVQYTSQPPPLGRDLNWNRHRRDVTNLTIFIESKWRMELTTQTIDFDRASVDDLLQLPVLFFSGGGNPLPEDEERQTRLAANLRDYVDRGGFIFADGETCSDDFDAGFRKLMDLVFQKPEYRFKPLDNSHPIWRADQKVPPDQARLLLGIDYGCRTSVVYSPANPPGNPRPSLACLWELSRGGPRAAYSPKVQEQIEGGLAIGANVLAYATNREFKPKDAIPKTIMVAGARDNQVRGKFAVAKLEHPGGCDAAPRALANLMEQAAHDLNIRVETHPKLINMQDPALFDYAVVFAHGRNGFRLTDGERQALREYVERGGLLFADAICGSEAFSQSFRREMALIFPKNPLEAIPALDPIWTTKYGGADLHLVMRRDPQPGRPGEPLQSTLRSVPPELKGVRFGDRWGVVFSEFDLSCALEKHNSMECRGYSREDAARIGLNILRYGMQQ